MNKNITSDFKQESVFKTLALSIGIAICVCVVALILIPILILKGILRAEWIFTGAKIVHCFAVLAGGVVLGKLINNNKFLILCCYACFYFVLMVGMGMLLFNIDSGRLFGAVIAVAGGAVCSIILLNMKKIPPRRKRIKHRYR